MRKIITLLLVTILCLGTFAGCSDENQTFTEKETGPSKTQIVEDLN